MGVRRAIRRLRKSHKLIIILLMVFFTDTFTLPLLEYFIALSTKFEKFTQQIGSFEPSGEHGA